ncbi:type II secretion system F family protein [Bifidobacterium minimum]|uniref:type II secretion system F family protein n=1 Tax=Bifidobacterium minimum TaxID=1693 RepID=UPI0003B6C7C7|nr:type II secretion system F family protein [Bifidobacterium minimum]
MGDGVRTFAVVAVLCVMAWRWTVISTRRGVRVRLGALRIRPRIWEVDVSETLLMGLMAVVMRSGSSVSRAVEVVASVLDDSRGDCLACVARELQSGMTWDDAWYSARAGGFAVEGLSLVRRQLESTWTEGASPVMGLEVAVDRRGREMAAESSRAASDLSVRVLLPVGLCMLPSFICMAVVPAVASVIMG